MVTSRRFLLPLLAICVLSLSFWYSEAWLRLCSGVALFLFGMQCLEEGLKQLAGSKLEQWLELSTSTRLKSFLFGVGGTMVLQSTTLVSMLTIAFLSTGMIQLAGGIAIVLGVNLGATGGMWLLAMAGWPPELGIVNHNFSGDCVVPRCQQHRFPLLEIPQGNLKFCLTTVGRHNLCGDFHLTAPFGMGLGCIYILDASQ